MNLDDKGELISEFDLTKNKVKKNLLESMLAYSRKSVSSQTNQVLYIIKLNEKKMINQEIKHKMNLVEERVYWRGTSDPNTYFHKLFQ